MTSPYHRLLALRHAPRELWLVYGLKVLESFSYFVSSLNLTPFLTSEFGLTDAEAGAVYSAWGVIAGVIGLVVGPAIDWLGVRPSLLIGGLLLTLGRALFAGATSTSQVYVSLFLLQPIGMTLAIPVLSVAIRRVTTDETRATAYGVFYSMMNVAALVSGLGTDALRSAIVHDTSNDVAALRMLFWLSTAVSALYLLVAAAAFRPLPAPDAEALEPGERVSMLQEARETARDPVFWRLVVFSGVIFGARSIFRHVDASLPKWMEREIGPAARYGTVYSINPAIIIFAVPLLQARLADRDPYTCIVVGTALTTLAPLALALLPASYAAAVLFMLLLSAGEATYSPRLYEYAMVLAPPGKEGLYGSLAAAPLFLVQVLGGGLGGELLAIYCPAEPPRRCQTMWLIIAATAATTPAGLVCMRNWLYNSEVRRRIQCGNDQPP